MDRSLWGAGALVIVIGLGYATMFMRRDRAGDEYLKSARTMVRQVSGYAQKPDYFDWLAETAHEQCFKDAYHMEGSRRRDRSWVDEGRYYNDLFDAMIAQANQDRATHIADALAKYKQQHGLAAEKRYRR